MAAPTRPTPSSPPWLWDLLGVDAAADGAPVAIGGRPFVVRDGILRDEAMYSAAQAQTADTFGFKWDRRDTFESEQFLAVVRSWLLERYGDVAAAPWWDDYGDAPVVVDAGCGAGMSALELFGDRLRKVRFLGADVSGAVDVARARFSERGIDGAAFLQADITNLPLPPASVDVVFSEGVLHHTDSTRGALLALAEHLRPGGRFLFYVYRTKSPVREFTDDYIRELLQDLPAEEAWRQMMPLTRLGQHLGELDVTIDVPEDVELLGIPKGPIPLQRFVYWYVFKAFYREDMSLDEMNHINYDWYAPRNAHRQTPEEVRSWCAEAGLDVEHERVEDAGITVIARRR